MRDLKMEIMAELRKLINEEIDKRFPPPKIVQGHGLPKTKEGATLLTNDPPKTEYSFNG